MRLHWFMQTPLPAANADAEIPSTAAQEISVDLTSEETPADGTPPASAEISPQASSKTSARDAVGEHSDAGEKAKADAVLLEVPPTIESPETQEENGGTSVLELDALGVFQSGNDDQLIPPDISNHFEFSQGPYIPEESDQSTESHGGPAISSIPLPAVRQQHAQQQAHHLQQQHAVGHHSTRSISTESEQARAAEAFANTDELLLVTENRRKEEVLKLTVAATAEEEHQASMPTQSKFDGGSVTDLLHGDHASTRSISAELGPHRVAKESNAKANLLLVEEEPPKLTAVAGKEKEGQEASEKAQQDAVDNAKAEVEQEHQNIQDKVKPLLDRGDLTDRDLSKLQSLADYIGSYEKLFSECYAQDPLQQKACFEKLRERQQAAQEVFKREQESHSKDREGTGGTAPAKNKNLQSSAETAAIIADLMGKESLAEAERTHEEIIKKFEFLVTKFSSALCEQQRDQLIQEYHSWSSEWAAAALATGHLRVRQQKTLLERLERLDKKCQQRMKESTRYSDSATRAAFAHRDRQEALKEAVKYNTQLTERFTELQVFFGGSTAAAFCAPLASNFEGISRAYSKQYRNRSEQNISSLLERQLSLLEIILPDLQKRCLEKMGHRDEHAADAEAGVETGAADGSTYSTSAESGRAGVAEQPPATVEAVRVAEQSDKIGQPPTVAAAAAAKEEWQPQGNPQQHADDDSNSDSEESKSTDHKVEDNTALTKRVLDEEEEKALAEAGKAHEEIGKSPGEEGTVPDELEQDADDLPLQAEDPEKVKKQREYFRYFTHLVDEARPILEEAGLDEAEVDLMMADEGKSDYSVIVKKLHSKILTDIKKLQKISNECPHLSEASRNSLSEKYLEKYKALRSDDDLGRVMGYQLFASTDLKNVIEQCELLISSAEVAQKYPRAVVEDYQPEKPAEVGETKDAVDKEHEINEDEEHDDTMALMKIMRNMQNKKTLVGEELGLALESMQTRYENTYNSYRRTVSSEALKLLQEAAVVYYAGMLQQKSSTPEPGAGILQQKPQPGRADFRKHHKNILEHMKKKKAEMKEREQAQMKAGTLSDQGPIDCVKSLHDQLEAYKSDVLMYTGFMNHLKPWDPELAKLGDEFLDGQQQKFDAIFHAHCGTKATTPSLTEVAADPKEEQHGSTLQDLSETLPEDDDTWGVHLEA